VTDLTPEQRVEQWLATPGLEQYLQASNLERLQLDMPWFGWDSETYGILQRYLHADNGTAGDDDAGVVDAYTFISQTTDPPRPLWGTETMNLIPEGGLCLLAGRPGVGKTTFALDLIVHLACGLPYPPADYETNGNAPSPWNVPRPLRVLVAEQEGPIEMFRAKLRKKLDAFPHDYRNGEGGIWIETLDWGNFSFRDSDDHYRIQFRMLELGIDLFVGDPLGNLGLEGVGSPADTRDFVKLLRPLGLGSNRSFLFLHHFRERVERDEDELQRISGSWGGHLDTLITLMSTDDAAQNRLAYPKIRWALEDTPPAIILGRVKATAGYQALHREADSDEILEPAIAAYLETCRSEGRGSSGKGWQSVDEIRRGIKKSKTPVDRALKGAPHLFARITKQQHHDLGGKGSASPFGLKAWLDDDEIEHQKPLGSEPSPSSPSVEFTDDDIPF
jgi:hypothetical protein